MARPLDQRKFKALRDVVSGTSVAADGEDQGVAANPVGVMSLFNAALDQGKAGQLKKTRTVNWAMRYMGAFDSGAGLMRVLKDFPDLASVISPPVVMKRLSAAMHEDNPAHLRDVTDLVEQAYAYPAFAEAITAILPALLKNEHLALRDYARLVNADFKAYGRFPTMTNRLSRAWGQAASKKSVFGARREEQSWVNSDFTDMLTTIAEGDEREEFWDIIALYAGGHVVDPETNERYAVMISIRDPDHPIAFWHCETENPEQTQGPSLKNGMMDFSNGYVILPPSLPPAVIEEIAFQWTSMTWRYRDHYNHVRAQSKEEDALSSKRLMALYNNVMLLRAAINQDSEVLKNMSHQYEVGFKYGRSPSTSYPMLPPGSREQKPERS